MASGNACDTQHAHKAQLCAGWPGCCAGCDPSSVWQIGEFPTGSAPRPSGASEIVARRRIWHQTASSDAVNPIAGFSPWKGMVAFRSSVRRTGARWICHSGTTSPASRGRQATVQNHDMATTAKLAASSDLSFRAQVRRGASMAVTVSDCRYHRPSTSSDAIDQLQRHLLVEINDSNLTSIRKRHVIFYPIRRRGTEFRPAGQPKE